MNTGSDVLDTAPSAAPDPACERLVRLAARLFRVPVAFISFLDGERHGVQARIGLATAETRHLAAFCDATLAGSEPCLVPDASRDPRFATHPFVLDAPQIRFYAGLPLRTGDGQALGTLGLMDVVPRADLSCDDRDALLDLGAVVVEQLVLRRKLAARHLEMRHTELRGRLLEATAGAAGFQVAADGAMAALREATGALICLLYRVAPDGKRLQLVGGQGGDGLVDEGYLAALRRVGMTLWNSATGQAIRTETQMVFDRLDSALLDRYPGMRLNAERGAQAQIITPVIAGHDRYAMALGFGGGATDLLVAQELLAEAVGTMRPLLRRLRDLEETELFRRAVEASDDAVLIGAVDQVSGERASIRYVNEAFLRQSGLTRAEIQGDRADGLGLIGGGPDLAERLGAQLARGETVREDVRTRRPDGREMWSEVTVSPLFDSAGWFTHWVAIQRDVTARRMETLALAERESSLRLFFEHHPAPMWVYDKDTLEFLEVNQTAVAEYGWSREEFLRMTALDIRPEEERAQAAMAMIRRRGGFSDTGPWRHQTRTGAIRLVQIRAQIVEYHGRRAALVAVWDLTDRIEAEKAVQELAADLHATFESIDDGLYTLDRDWRFTYVNARAQRLVGLPPGEMVGRMIWEVWPHLAGSELAGHFQRVAETRETERFDHYFVGRAAWFAIAAYPSRDGITVWFRDVTDHRRAQAQLEAQSQMLAQARDAIIVRDLDHRIEYWNRSAERLFGWTREEMLGQRATDRLSADPARFEAAMEVLLEHGYWEGQLEPRRKDGVRLVVDANWTLLRREDGTPRGVLVVNSDVTERVALEGKLRQAQRMEAVGQLTGGIAHDFNNLLTVILGNAEMMAEILADPQLASMAQTVVSAAERGAELTGRLLAFSRRQVLDPKTVDVNRLLASLVEMLRRTLGNEVELVIKPEPGLWNGLIDPPQLENAVLNLCLNARDAMPGGGRLVIQTGNVALDGAEAAEEDAAPGEYVMVGVTDTGTGMTPEVVAHAFEPFFTTKEVGAGSGLGLSMVYGFVKQSNGHVRIHSEPGRGTSVRMYIPRAEGPGARLSSPPALERLPGGREHVLLVEDDPLVRAHGVRQLRELGYRVTLAESAAEALAAVSADARAGGIDLLFTDVVMPGGMNGPDLARAVLRLRPGLPVLFTSGYTESAIIRQGRLEPGTRLLQKPYHRRELAEAIRRALDSRPRLR